MSERDRESISALMDGEADELELRRLLSAKQDVNVDPVWSRYHLVRDVMQNDQQSMSFRHLDISKQVSQAISDEAPLLNQSSSVASTDGGFQWLRPVAGFAVAASVAVAVVFGVQSINPSASGLNTEFANANQPAVASRVYPVQIATQNLGSMQASGEMVTYSNAPLPGGIAASRAAADLEAQNRLEKYMLRHTESAALNNGQGMISFARVASFETE